MSADEIAEEKSRRRRRRRGESDISEDGDESLSDEERGLTERKGRATRSRRSHGEVVESSNFVVRTYRSLREYFAGVGDELDKVVWPTREELIRLTRIVLMVTIVASIVLGIISFFFTELFILGFENEIIFVIAFAVVFAAYLFVTRVLNRRNKITPY